jgi:hypothetical protein
MINAVQYTRQAAYQKCYYRLQALRRASPLSRTSELGEKNPLCGVRSTTLTFRGNSHPNSEEVRLEEEWRRINLIVLVNATHAKHLVCRRTNNVDASVLASHPTRSTGMGDAGLFCGYTSPRSWSISRRPHFDGLPSRTPRHAASLGALAQLWPYLPGRRRLTIESVRAIGAVLHLAAPRLA